MVRELQVWANGNFRECVTEGANNLCGEAHAYEYREKTTLKALVDGRTDSFLHFGSQHHQQRQTPPICWAQQHHSLSWWEVAASSQGAPFPESRHICTATHPHVHTLLLVLIQGQQLPSIFWFVLVLLAPNLKMKGLDCQAEGFLAFIEKNSASYRL